MESDDAAQFGDGLVYGDTIPIGWQDVGKEISSAHILRMHQANERVLRCFSVIEEYRAETADEDHAHVVHDLSRFEFKLNLLLDMVARLLVEHVSLPTPAPVKMSGSAIRWRAPTAPAIGEMISLDIYLNQGYPIPITLYAEVRGVTAVDEGFQIDAQYREMSESVRSWLEKMIFRYHRRQIALSRQHGRG